MKIAVIGAGLTGLTAGYCLAKAGHTVDVFEESEYIGGLVSAVEAGNGNLDRFYHHVFVSDTYLLDLTRELGIENKIKWYEPKNAIFIDNRIYPFTSPIDLLRFKPVDFLSRIRMGLLVLSAKFIRDYKSLKVLLQKTGLLHGPAMNATKNMGSASLIQI